MFGGPESAIIQNASQQDFTGSNIRRTVEGVAGAFKRVSDTQQKKGTITGGLRAANSDATQSRMALPLSDVAKFGSESFSKNAKLAPNTQSSLTSDFDLYNKLSDRSLQDRGAMGNQDIDLTKRKIKEVDTLANNEANRALGNELATKFPYHKYDTEADAFKSVTNNMLSPSRFASLASTQIKPMQYVSF